MTKGEMMHKILGIVLVCSVIGSMLAIAFPFMGQAAASLATIHILDDHPAIREAMEAGSLNESSIPADDSDPTIGFGQTISASIDMAAEMDTYTFSANADDAVLVRMSRSSGSLDPEIRLCAPNGTELDIAWLSSPPEISSILPDTGEYTVLACSHGGTDTGDYGIFVQRLNNPGNATAIGFGETVSASIDMAAEMDTYTFFANADDAVLIRMIRTSGDMETGIRLYATDGTKLDEYERIIGAEISYTLPSTGNYTILAYDADGTCTGEYNIYLQKTSSVEKPDLVISKIKCDRESNRVGYAVKNIGNAVASACHDTALWVNDEKVCEDHVDVDLDPEGTYEGWFDCYEWPEYQTIEVMVCADNYDAVVESNEDNNCRECVLGVCGDVAPYACCDGIVNMGDVVLLLNYVGHPGEYQLCCEWCGDVAPCPASDGLINMGDVVLLLNYVGHPGEYELCCG